MDMGDEYLRARILDRLISRSTDLNEHHAARKRIENELEALAIAEDEGREDDVYRHLVSIGTCYGVIADPAEALKYFKRAADEFPEKRMALFIVIMILRHLDEEEELAKYTRLYEDRFPPRIQL
jgi:tetratricopeptide (TPR) repeat protein